MTPAEQESRALAQPRDDKDAIFAFSKLNASRDGPFSPNFFQACPSPRRAMHRICLPGVPRETCATRAGTACRDRTWVHASHVTRIDDALDGDRSRRAHAARSVAAPPIGRARPEFDELFVSKTGQTVRSYVVRTYVAVGHLLPHRAIAPNVPRVSCLSRATISRRRCDSRSCEISKVNADDPFARARSSLGGSGSNFASSSSAECRNETQERDWRNSRWEFNLFFLSDFS